MALRGRKTVLFVVAALLAGVLTTVTITETDGRDGVNVENVVIEVPEGPGSRAQIRLDAAVYRPSVVPAPAVLLAHHLGGDKNSVSVEATSLARRGFVVLSWTARGFGASGGEIGLNAPEYEVADGRALVDWLADRADVAHDGPGDPRVGVAGASYGGALALLLAGTDGRIDALAPAFTWNDLAQALFPNAATRAPVPAATPAAGAFAPDGVLKRDWAASYFGAELVAGAGGADMCGRLRPELCAAWVRAATAGRATPELSALLRRSSPATVADDITAPTLLVQGEHDTLFGLDQADATARQLARTGAPVKIVWYPGGHDGADPGPELREQVYAWFDYHLRGLGEDPGTGFQYQLQGMFGTRRILAPRIVTMPVYPGLDGVPVQRRELVLHGETQPVIRPPGGYPAALSSLPGLDNALRESAADLDGLAMDLPGQVATFLTDELADPLQVVGAATVRLRVAAAAQTGLATPPDEAVLFVKLYDVGPDGHRTLPGGAVAPVRMGPLPADGAPIEMTVTLAAVVRLVETGHRLAVAVTTTDRGYALPPQPAAYTVSLTADDALTIPVVPGEQMGAPLPIFQLAGLGALAALVLTVPMVVALRRRRGADADVQLVEAPLVASGLTKRYPGGLTAVDGLSFRLERGQVLGLLGPNGAGKTTVLRMLMGLIRPTNGEMRAFGHSLSPGAPVLSRIGSFVEGPGFMPHLSGAENLRLYWAATGRPVADAGIDGVLEIARLGDSAGRRVETYSQGMRQRLAIAQAMLGRPDVLVLDEPTNGLDPPQIRAVREMLRGYVVSGASVLISSHLLSEVEQVCSHVVVMNKGRLVAAGTVAEITAPDDAVMFAVDDPLHAVTVLRRLGGVEVTAVDQRVVHARLDGVPRSAAVSALVGGGVRVEGVTGGRDRLEEAFLRLVAQ